MRQRCTSVMVIAILLVSLLGGCSGTETGAGSQDKITGVVTEISRDSIVVEPTSVDGGEQDEMEIKITGETTFKRQDMGEPPQGGQQPPGKPEGEAAGEDAQSEPPQDGQQPPEKPEGEAAGEDAQSEPPQDGQQPPENGEAALADIGIGDTVTVTLDPDGSAKEIVIETASQGGPGEAGGGMGQMSAPESYAAVKEYTSDAKESSQTLASTETDENVLHVYNGAEVTLSEFKLSRDSGESAGGDASSFYGIGAAALVTDGTVYIEDSDINTNAAGAAGVFAYGSGTAHVSDTKIVTQKGTSGGVHVAGGGTLYAEDLEVETNGDSSAAIRSDRGGGKMVISGGSYTSNGNGSPAIYSTADIDVKDAELSANGSEAICIEGKNSIHLTDSDLSGNMRDDEQNDCTWNVILYQSMSGDSEVGNSTFEMTGGSLTAKNGGMFYTTNTESTFTLSDVDITYADDSEFFLRCTGNRNRRGWGTAGENGADCTFKASEQEMKGDIVWDSISSLDLYMSDGSSLTGAVTDDETCAGAGGDGYCNLSIGKGCVWTVTGDSVLSTLSCEGKITDESGRAVTIKGTDGTVYIAGDSGYTVTVDEYK